MMAILSRGHILLDDVPGVERPRWHLHALKYWVWIIIESSFTDVVPSVHHWIFQCIIKKVEHLNISQVWL